MSRTLLLHPHPLERCNKPSSSRKAPAKKVLMDHNYNNWEPDSRDGRIITTVIKFDYVQFSLTKMGAYFSSDHVVIHNTAIPMVWYIEIGREKRSGIDTMSFWANCRPVDDAVKESGAWYCYAELDFRLLPVDRDEDCVITWKHTDLFSKATGAAGFYEFDGWNDIRDPKNGFIRNDSITVEVVIKEMCTFTIGETIVPIAPISQPSATTSLSSSSYTTTTTVRPSVPHLPDSCKVINSNCNVSTSSVSGCGSTAQVATDPQRLANSSSCLTFYDLTQMIPADKCNMYKSIIPDVVIEFGNYRIKSHRSILSKTLSLRNKLNRIASSLPSSHVIHLTLPNSFDIDAFMSICNFLYKDEIILDKYNVGLVFSMATTLRIEAIRRACICVLSPTTVLLVLSELHKSCRDDDLYDDCESTFVKLSRKAVRSKAFKRMEKSLLKKILVINELRCREIQLFEAVVTWAEAECIRKNLPVNPGNMRAVLGDCLYNIRFGHMTKKEFKCGSIESKKEKKEPKFVPKLSGLLTREEIKMIKKFRCSKVPDRGFLFPTKERTPEADE